LVKKTITVPYVPYDPETGDFIVERFFSDELHIEHTIIVTALKIAHLIGKQLEKKLNVYLVGFDFSMKKGYTRKIPSAAFHADLETQARTISNQEKYLKLIIKEKDRLSINICHIGNKEYSFYSVKAFNKILNENFINPLKDKESSYTNRAGQQVKIVAEITTNHFGDMARLKSMIIAAKKAGADYIKLQKRNVLSFYTEDQLNKPYSSPFGDTFREYRLGIELNKDQFRDVDELCKDIGIGWFASILDVESYEFIKQFNPEIIKLPSTISEHKVLLERVAGDFTKDVVISTGYTSKDYEDYIFNTFRKCRSIYLLQCVSAYPTPLEAAQVGVVRHYYSLSRDNKRIIPGYSSHDFGSLCSVMSVAAGARMIEKHVKFGDVSWSHFDEVAVDLITDDFKSFIDDIRQAELIVGSEHKEIYNGEHHKYWVASKK
jgi:sialic acid synthase SpsE